MKAALMTVRGAGALSLLLGLAVWADLAAVLTPIHMLLGLILVVALVAAALIGLRTGVSAALAAVAVVWAVVTLLFGLSQQQLLPGDGHLVVEVAHLAIGVVAIGIGEAIGAASRRVGAAASH